MPCVTKCCCCCSLKYGYFTYAILALISRVCFIITSYSMLTYGIRLHYGRTQHFVYGEVVALPICWCICAAVANYIALKGIIQRRAMLLFPYIVVLISEIVAGFLTTVISAIAITPFALFAFIFIAIDIYEVICLSSLYGQMKGNERHRPMMMENVAYKTVV